MDSEVIRRSYPSFEQLWGQSKRKEFMESFAGERLYVYKSRHLKHLSWKCYIDRGLFTHSQINVLLLPSLARSLF